MTTAALTDAVTHITYRGYSLRLRGKKWVYWNGQKQVSASAVDVAKASIDALLSRQDTAERMSSVPVISIKDALIKWRENAVLKNLDDTSIRGTLLTWKKFDESLNVHDVTKDLVLSKLSENEYANSSKRTMLFHVRSVLTFCKSNKMMVDEAVYTIPLPSNAECKKKVVITQDQVKAFLDYHKDRDWRVYQLGLCMAVWGIRPDNITYIKKVDYNKAERTVTLKANTSKNRKTVMLPVTADIEFYLDKAVKENANDYLLNSSDGKQWTVEGVQSVMKRAKDIGIVPSSISWYSFRLAKDKEYIDKGLNPYDHAALMGHSPATVAKSYYRMDMNKVISQLSDKVYFKYYDGTTEHKFETIGALVKFVKKREQKEVQ